MIAAAEMYDKDAAEKIIKNACSIELGHTASLIFDDKPSMDNANVRRGKESCHVKFGEDIADLTGIYLINHTYRLNVGNKIIPPQNTLNALMLISKSTGLEGMVGGQEKDLKGETKDIDELKRFYAKKSGGLYAISAAIGGILFNAKKEDASLLFNYGKNLGISYQFMDDVLDVVGDSNEMGKSTNMDSKKITAVDILGIDGAIKESQKIKDKALENLSYFGDKANALKEVSEVIVKTPEIYDKFDLGGIESYYESNIMQE